MKEYCATAGLVCWEDGRPEIEEPDRPRGEGWELHSTSADDNVLVWVWFREQPAPGNAAVLRVIGGER